MSELGSVRIRTHCDTCPDKCCSQPHDWVYLTEGEVSALERASRVGRETFVEQVSNPVNGLTFATLRLPCAFLSKSGRCTVYAARPLTCRLFPLYPDPLVGRMMFLPAECGDRVIAADDDDERGWSIAEYEEDVTLWFNELWREATRS